MDAPGVARRLNTIWKGSVGEIEQARLIALKTPHSSNWLFTLLTIYCGLCLSNDAMQVAVGLRLDLNICEHHTCPCGVDVGVRGTHGLSCKKSSDRSTRHHQLNDLIWQASRRANITATKKPMGLLRGDGILPDGLTLVP